jgi:hypothetical protein
VQFNLWEIIHEYQVVKLYSSGVTVVGARRPGRQRSATGVSCARQAPDGRIFGRNRFGDILLCDACGTRRGPVRLRGAAVTS